MADLGLPGFTFGFSFIYEQTRRHWGELCGVPLLPSLQDENRVGWDAILPTVGTNYYYQFKRSELLQRSNAKHISEGPYLDPYFRFYLHKSNYDRQRRFLWEHAQKLGNHNIYYVTPETVSRSKFRAAFMNNTIHEHSKLIPLRGCHNYPFDNGKLLYITYEYNVKGFHQYSDSYKGDGDIFRKNIESLFEKSEKDLVPIDENYSDNFLKNTINSIEDLVKDCYLSGVQKLLDVRFPETKIEKILFSAKILSAAFGISAELVGKKGENSGVK